MILAPYLVVALLHFDSPSARPSLRHVGRFTSHLSPLLSPV